MISTWKALITFILFSASHLGRENEWLWIIMCCHLILFLLKLVETTHPHPHPHVSTPRWMELYSSTLTFLTAILTYTTLDLWMIYILIFSHFLLLLMRLRLAHIPPAPITILLPVPEEDDPSNRISLLTSPIQSPRESILPPPPLVLHHSPR